MQGPCKISEVLRFLQVLVSLINIESRCVLGPWVPLMSGRNMVPVPAGACGLVGEKH